MNEARPIKADEIRRMTVPFEVKSVKMADDSTSYAGEIEGYAAGIHNIDRAGDMILPGAFAADLPRFLSEGVVCWQHDWADPIGAPVEAREDSFGLWTKSRISKTTRGVDAMTLIRDGVVKKMSIGYSVQDYESVNRSGLMAYLAGTTLAEERKAGILAAFDEMDIGFLFLLKKIKLYEYSPVSIPANPNAMITDAKSLTGLTFAQHSEAVLTAVEGLVERIAGITALRSEQGRKANPAHLELIDKLSDQAAGVITELHKMAESLRPEEEPAMIDPAEVKRLHAQFLRLQAQQLGVQI